VSRFLWLTVYNIYTVLLQWTHIYHFWQIQNYTRKLCYRKDDRAMRRGCPENFPHSLTCTQPFSPKFFTSFCSDRPYECAYKVSIPSWMFYCMFYFTCDRCLRERLVTGACVECGTRCSVECVLYVVRSDHQSLQTMAGGAALKRWWWATRCSARLHFDRSMVVTVLLIEWAAWLTTHDHQASETFDSWHLTL